eukprot:TRINITY_DN31947_c0_g1_i1.p3 TRINITY_DN31947_c0_g1~~TRINITY_DN31947_c0_g1_i1.p3  ORF type:complete len:123 (+),score=29.47 TRINITY_DN31947_c0_g1_i1:89-457(+)
MSSKTWAGIAVTTVVAAAASYFAYKANTPKEVREESVTINSRLAQLLKESAKLTEDLQNLLRKREAEQVALLERDGDTSQLWREREERLAVLEAEIRIVQRQLADNAKQQENVREQQRFVQP